MYLLWPKKRRICTFTEWHQNKILKTGYKLKTPTYFWIGEWNRQTSNNIRSGKITRNNKDIIELCQLVIPLLPCKAVDTFCLPTVLLANSWKMVLWVHWISTHWQVFAWLVSLTRNRLNLVGPKDLIIGGLIETSLPEEERKFKSHYRSPHFVFIILCQILSTL